MSIARLGVWDIAYCQSYIELNIPMAGCGLQMWHLGGVLHLSIQVHNGWMGFTGLGQVGWEVTRASKLVLQMLGSAWLGLAGSFSFCVSVAVAGLPRCLDSSVQELWLGSLLIFSVVIFFPVQEFGLGSLLISLLLSFFSVQEFWLGSLLISLLLSFFMFRNSG